MEGLPTKMRKKKAATLNFLSCINTLQLSVFEMEAVSIGEVLTIEIVLRNYYEFQQSFKWKCEQVHVLDGETNLFFIFKFNKMFSEKLNNQQVKASRLNDAL
ncbi:unnamed protein product [Thelazia callipaeda]|uniref:Uncharacterized protein n=1 Tax=Thelazia callipaeda TaxID=103827 RepID=A0A158RB07_THECL|nr:unnamed protein product [Thelazia callipaeda]